MAGKLVPDVGSSSVGRDLYRDQAEQVYTLVSFWVGGTMYGMYCVLFIGAIWVMRRRGITRQPASYLVFFVSMFVMFILNTIYFGISIYSFIDAYALGASPIPNMPVYYFRDLTSWHSFAYPVIIVMLVIHADALVIYRCFVVWQHNYHVIIVPSLLLLLSVVINSVCMYWRNNMDKIEAHVIRVFFQMIYPVNLAQNILTTGLISYKIGIQYYQSRRAGLSVVSGMDMLTIIRIVMESAMLYTVQQFVVLILYSIDHPAQVILHASMVPTVGIVFALMAIRTHAARLSVKDSTIRFPHSGRLSTDSTHNTRAGRSMAIITTVTTQQHTDDRSDLAIKMDVLEGGEEGKV